MWTPEAIVNLKKVQEMRRLKRETVMIFYLRQDGIFGKRFFEAQGDKCEVQLPPVDEFVKGAQKTRSNQVVIVHNHPPIFFAQDATPSQGDVVATDICKEELQKRGIRLVDHIIVTEKNHFSFAQNGLI
jgi:DNA repair protein RadC